MRYDGQMAGAAEGRHGTAAAVEPHRVSSWTRSPWKRVFDLVSALVGLALLWPFFLIVALCIKLEDGGPVFYRQVRVGRRGRLFRIWKFRTMVVNADRIGAPLTREGDPRVTRVGRVLRRFKLDELPQLFNVVAGEMSLVGPRPEVPALLQPANEMQRRVLELRPGITDPASLRFRAEAELLAKVSSPEEYYLRVLKPEKMRMNLEYARRAGFLNDLRLILETLVSLVHPRDGSCGGPVPLSTTEQAWIGMREKAGSDPDRLSCGRT